MAQSSESPGKPLLLKRSEQVAEQIKQWIMEQGLAPGQRLPPEKELIELFGVSRSTVRETLKGLESQGLVHLRTGPPGGAVVQRIPQGRAISLLGDHFYFENLTLDQIYTVRRALEPELAAAVASSLTDEHMARLEDATEACRHPPGDSAEEYRQRMAELDFHDVLAEACDNALLAFHCRFINVVIRQCIVYRKLYAGGEGGHGAPPHLEMRPMSESGLHHHERLLDAFRAGDAELARERMADHMDDAWRHMHALEAAVERLIVSEPRGVTFLAPHPRPEPDEPA